MTSPVHGDLSAPIQLALDPSIASGHHAFQLQLFREQATIRVRSPTPRGRSRMVPTEIDNAQVMVVGRSPVTLIVLSRIVERARMRPLIVEPDGVEAAIARSCPAIVLLDGGPDMTDCAGALSAIRLARRLTAGRGPHVILLTTVNPNAAPALSDDCFDETVTKPVTPDRLQPMIEIARDRMQAF